MSDTLQYLERIQRDAQQVQRLADDLEHAREVHEARKIRREMVRISKGIEQATKAADDLERYEEIERQAGA